MLLASYAQELDPLKNSAVFSQLWSPLWSTLFSALPVLTLFYFLVPRRWLAPKAGAMGALVALVVAVTVYGMPAHMAVGAFVYGVCFGLLPVGWTILAAMLLYNITVETGQFTIVRRSVAALSGDARIQAVLIGFSFGAFLEGAAGGGTPVAICGAIMVGLGFHPFLAAVICLIANTSPVAYGGLGTPIVVLADVTGLKGESISTMAGHQLPFLSCIIPIWMVKCMCTWRQTREVLPALLVAGISFAGFQYAFATWHVHFPGYVIYHMTDIGGGIFSLIVTAIFLKFWKPKKEWHFHKKPEDDVPVTRAEDRPAIETEVVDSHAKAAASLMGPSSRGDDSYETRKLTFGNVSLAWAPFVIMSISLVLTGILREKESKGPIQIIGSLYTNYLIPIPGLHKETYRDELLHPVKAEDEQLKPISAEEAAALVLSSQNPFAIANSAQLTNKMTQRPESALFNFAWLTGPGSPVFIACVLSAIMLRMNFGQIRRVLHRTMMQMKIPIPTIACMLGLSYVTRYAGMDATLGYAFAQTGVAYPFFAAMLGWLGVFLTGTDAGSNALFGSLQKITATAVYSNHHAAFGSLGLEQTQVLISTANSTGGVMGKMIDAQSICVATAATNQLGREADIFKAVIWHSVILASIIGLLTLLQAYVDPFRSLVP